MNPHGQHAIQLWRASNSRQRCITCEQPPSTIRRVDDLLAFTTKQLCIHSQIANNKTVQ